MVHRKLFIWQMLTLKKNDRQAYRVLETGLYRSLNSASVTLCFSLEPEESIKPIFGMAAIMKTLYPNYS